MLQDLKVDLPSRPPEAEVCIVGAGAAGISLALKLAQLGVSVLLLEGGADHFTAESTDVYAGTCESPLSDRYLTGSRLRFLGGTTNHWLGYCLRLDPIDFEARSWVADSGWPFDHTELDRFYLDAAPLCAIEAPIGIGSPLTEGSDVLRKPLAVEATRFGELYAEALAASDRVQLLLNANLVRIHANADGTAVDHLAVAAPSGERLQVKAEHVVLAAGGLENARLLLVSNDVQKDGLGNGHDLVGRYFMDHPVFPVAAVVVGQGGPLLENPQPREEGLRLSDARQRELELLNCSLSFAAVPQVADTRRQLLEQSSWQRLAGYLESDELGGTSWWKKLYDPWPSGLHATEFTVRPEAPPLRDSRLRLGEGKDAYGNPRSHLQWKLSGDIVRTVRKTMEEIALELGRRGYGRLFLDDEALERGVLSPGYHHMGTTRMHDDPRQGVVDRHCKVHGLENLYVAGSSVFPTGGVANPTYTLVALALRLAEHLKATKL